MELFAKKYMLHYQLLHTKPISIYYMFCS